MVHPATAANEKGNQGVAVSGHVVDSAGNSATPKFDAFLNDAAVAGKDPDSTAYDSILAQIMNADSPDAVLTPVEITKGEDVLNVPLWLTGFSLNQSEYDVGSPFYATMACMKPADGEPLIVNTGHKKVLAQLVRLQQLNDGDNPEFHYPFPIMFVEKGRSAVNSPMHELRKWEPAPETEQPPF